MNVIQLILDGSAIWVHRHADVRYIEHARCTAASALLEQP